MTSTATHISRHLTAILIAAAVSAVTVIVSPYLPFLRAAENWTQDVRVALLSKPLAIAQEIVIVRFTEDTLAQLTYRSPVDREFLANLLTSLETKGARLVGVDVLFDRPTDPRKDQKLRNTLSSMRVPVVVANVFSRQQLTAAQSSYLHGYLSALQTGDITVRKDLPDLTVRRIHLGSEVSGVWRPGFAAAIVVLLGGDVPGGETIALDYRRRQDLREPSFLLIDAHHVEQMPDVVFKDKVVLVGADLPLEDRHATPFTAIDGDSMPGVIVHAHSLSQLLDARSVNFASSLGSAVTVFIYSILGVALASINVPVLISVALMLGFVGVAWTGTAMIYHSGGLLIPLISPSGAFLLTGVTIYAYFTLRERRQRLFITDAFRHFLAPAVIDDLIANPNLLRLSGEQREMTFLFTDIAGFTNLTDTLRPDVLVGLLNEYLAAVCDIVLTYGGTIDKIVGDALHVIFNAPSQQLDHAERAVQCALALDEFSERFIERKKKVDIDFGETRIGINTGTATVGNFGGDQRFDYTAHGTPINTAARLESANKYFGTRICVSETTTGKVESVDFRPIARVLLKGLSTPIQVYEPANSHMSASHVRSYLHAYSLLHSDPERSMSAFSQLSDVLPNDPLVKLHIDRLTSGQIGDELILKEK